MILFITTLQQVGVLLTFILIGYFFRKKEMITDNGKKVLANLLANFFAPCYTAMSLSKVVNVNDIAQYFALLLAGVGITALGIFLANIFAKPFSQNRLNRNILIYAFSFGNIGYFGYPVVAAIFGEIMRAQMMLFCLPMSIAIYTYGYYILTSGTAAEKQEKRSITQKLSFLWKPPMMGAYFGILLGLFSSGLNFPIPIFITDILTVAGNCQSALAMLLTGAVLANLPFNKLFMSWRPYLVGMIRLFVLPLITGIIFFIIHLLGVSGETFKLIFRLSIIVSALPVGMNTVVFPESVGKDATEGAKTCFMSYLLALGMMPLVFMGMEYLVMLF